MKAGGKNNVNEQHECISELWTVLLFNEQGELKSMIYLPHDGQLLADFKTLDLMTKAMAYRWGILKPSRKRS